MYVPMYVCTECFVCMYVLPACVCIVSYSLLTTGGIYYAGRVVVVGVIALAGAAEVGHLFSHSSPLYLSIYLFSILFPLSLSKHSTPPIRATTVHVVPSQPPLLPVLLTFGAFFSFLPSSTNSFHPSTTTHPPTKCQRPFSPFPFDHRRWILAP